MKADQSMTTHLDRLDELMTELEAVGDVMDPARQLVVLLGSLPAEYNTIVSIFEGVNESTLIKMKEKLIKEHATQVAQETEEALFKAAPTRTNGRRRSRSPIRSVDSRRGSATTTMDVESADTRKWTGEVYSRMAKVKRCSWLTKMVVKGGW
ncbi:hypothetical protein PI125_g19398 [Phytophthora idaei]|nr:hypothetical protein PI125_g19398 [Phytophthora idaei]